jgi:hypothetical protein
MTYDSYLLNAVEKYNECLDARAERRYEYLLEVERGLIEGKAYGTSSAESNDLLENLYQYRKDITIGLLKGDRDAVWALLIKGLVETLDDIVNLTFEDEE